LIAKASVCVVLRLNTATRKAAAQIIG
jgi:hypothetical protein